MDQLYRFIDPIKEKLFEAEERRLKAGIDRLVEQHDELSEPIKRFMGFMFNGDIYRHSRANLIYKSYPMLDWSLNEEMEAWLKDRKAVQLDKDQIGQMLFRLQSHVMNGSEHVVQERRDALPECLVSLVPKFQAMPRNFNIQFFLTSERDIRQYAKILPKIEMYAMSKLIY